MMKALVAATILFSGVALAAASDTGPIADAELPTKASGNGSMTFAVEDHNVLDDDEEHGRGFIQFTVQIADGQTSGSMLFGAEHHHALYPDIIVRVSKITEAEFSKHAVKFEANGKLHNELVQVKVVATDGAGEDHHDSFSITCLNSSGEVAFEAEGELFSGDIVVGVPQ